MNIVDLLQTNPKGFGVLEKTLKSQFNLVAHSWCMKTDCMDSYVWGSGQRTDDAVVVGVDMQSSHPRASVLPDKIDLDQGGSLPVLYTTQGGPASAYDW